MSIKESKTYFENILPNYAPTALKNYPENPKGPHALSPLSLNTTFLGLTSRSEFCSSVIIEGMWLTKVIFVLSHTYVNWF